MGESTQNRRQRRSRARGRWFVADNDGRPLRPCDEPEFRCPDCISSLAVGFDERGVHVFVGHERTCPSAQAAQTRGSW